MNAIKIGITAPLVIVLFVNGVYCPGFYHQGAGIHRPETPEPEFPSHYQLQGCRLHSSTVESYLPSPTYEFDCSGDDPSTCRLKEHAPSSGVTLVYPFRKSDIKFILMIDEEITMNSHAPWMAWSATCQFSSVTMARKFYKYIIRGRQPELELLPFVWAIYLKNSDDSVLAEPANLFCESEGDDTIIMVENQRGEAVLIFPKSAVSQRIQHENEPTRIDLNIRQNPTRTMLYKFNFSTSEQMNTTPIKRWFRLVRSTDKL